jgi:hypothetical protein
MCCEVLRQYPIACLCASPSDSEKVTLSYTECVRFSMSSMPGFLIEEILEKLYGCPGIVASVSLDVFQGLPYACFTRNSLDVFSSCD